MTSPNDTTTDNEDSGSQSSSLSAMDPPVRRKREESGGEGLWLMSFSDLSLTLLAFFILMISMMSPNKEQYENVTEGMVTDAVRQVSTTQQIARDIKDEIVKQKIEGAAEVRYETTGLVVEFKDKLLFSSGSGQMKSEVLDSLDGVLRSIAMTGKRHTLVIEGHTDEVKLAPGGAYLSNWELSAARGFAMMRQLRKLGVPSSRMSVQAFAHTRPEVPYAGLKGKKLEQARAKNRRVLIRIN